MIFKSKPRFDQLDQYLANKDYSSALEAIAEEIKSKPENFNLLLRQAEILASAGQQALAVELYRKVARFFAEQGFYARAADAISTAAADRGSDAKLAALLRAYAGSFLYDAYLLSDPPDDALLARAREALVEALRLDPALSLPAKYFSPRVVSFFDGIKSSLGRRRGE